MSKTVYRIVILSIAVILLLSGTYIGVKISKNVVKNEVVTEPIDNVEQPTSVAVINQVENKDIEVIYEDYYTNCKEVITNKNMEFGTTKEKIKEKVDKGYTLVEETENSIKFRKEINSNCPNHFELRLEDGYVKIYQLVSDEVSTIYKNTEIPRSSIRDELVDELEKGIRVNTLEELNSYIEDMES
jgi:hypothetical protein